MKEEHVLSESELNHTQMESHDASPGAMVFGENNKTTMKRLLNGSCKSVLAVDLAAHLRILRPPLGDTSDPL